MSEEVWMCFVCKILADFNHWILFFSLGNFTFDSDKTTLEFLFLLEILLTQTTLYKRQMQVIGVEAKRSL